MQEVYPFFIFLSIVGLLMGLLYVYIHTKSKNKEPYLIASAFFSFLLPFLMIAGMLLNSEKLIVSAFFFPIGLLIIVTSIELLIRYKKCNYVISAKYVSFARVSSHSVSRYAPQFSFNYNGETFEVNSFICYFKRKLKKIFDENYSYDIYINPQNPNHCVDKRYFPVSTVVGLILGIMLIIFSTIIVILI